MPFGKEKKRDCSGENIENFFVIENAHKNANIKILSSLNNIAVTFKHNRPDIAVWDKLKDLCTTIEIICPTNVDISL